MFPRLYLTAVVAAGLYLATASPQLLPPPATCARTYQVVSGDTCDAISVAQNVSTYQLALNNPTVNAACDNLFVGQTLCLGIQGQDCSTVHLVAAGDSCDAITAAANITFATLLANNPNVDAGCTNIYPGEVLCTATAPVYVR